MRIIDPSPYVGFMGEPARASLGMRPGLAWLPIANLRIDEAYQREVLRHGARNIGKIARQFDWDLFGIVVVSNIGNQLFAIVDGQHRTIAAAMRDIREVPCIVIEANPAKQAATFAAINGSVTTISPLSIFAAQVAAGEPSAVHLTNVCAEAGVTICKYPVPASHMKQGDTIAVRALEDCQTAYGDKVLNLTLRGILKASRGQPGFVKAPVVKAIAHVLEAEPSWCQHETRLLSAMERFDISRSLTEAEINAKAIRKQVHKALALLVFDHLDKELA